MIDAVIIGGGLSGLTCAVALADRGLQVVVVEREALPGGRARSWIDQTTGDTVDIGPHVVQSEYRNMLALLKRLGTSELITWQSRKVLTIASSPHPFSLRHWPLPVPLSLMPSMLTAPGPPLYDHLSAAKTIWRGMQFGEEEVAALDRISAQAFLRSQGMTQRMIDWWWAFASMVTTNVPVDRCSAAAIMRIHAQLSGHRNLHFGFGAVGLAELYAPQAVDIVQTSGGKFLTQTHVRGFIGVDRAEAILLNDGTLLRARHFVSAVPPQDLALLLPDAWKEHMAFETLSCFEPCPYISCYLWFDRKIRCPRFISHLCSPTRLNYDFYDLSRIRRGWKNRPSIFASNIIYSHRAQGMSDKEIVQATVREIIEFAPDAAHARVLHSRVHRIPMAIPCPLPGTEVRRPHTQTAIPGLVLAGDWVRTQLPYCMESAVCSGWLAAEQVLAERGTPHRLAFPPRPYDGLAGLVRRATQWYRRRSTSSPSEAG